MYVPSPFEIYLMTEDVKNLAAETAACLTTKHPDYAILAARIAVSNLHKETKRSFTQVIYDLYSYGPLRLIVLDVLLNLASQSQEWSLG